MAEGNSAIGSLALPRHEDGERRADDIASSHDDAVLAGGIDTVTREEFHDTGGGGGEVSGEAQHHFADVVRMETVHVFIGVDVRQDFFLGDVAWEGELDDISVNVVICIEAGDHVEELRLGESLGESQLGAHHPDGLARLDFIGNVGLTRGIIPHEDSHEMRGLLTPGNESRNLIGQFFFDLRGDLFPVNKFHMLSSDV
jgi:hypothetical protein